MTVFILSLFVIFKMIQEALFTELPKTAKLLYGHSSQDVGWYYLISSVYAVPIALMPAQLAKKYADRYILLWGTVIYLIGTIIKINYTYDGHMNMA